MSKETASSERELREQISLHGKSLFDRGLTGGATGNISVKLPDGLLVTPTNSCLGRIDPDRISKLDSLGNVVSGDKPSKEAFLHHAMYGVREEANAIVHLHSTYSVAVSCLADVDPNNILPPITAYYVMKVGRLPLVPYFAPGDQLLAQSVADHAREAHSLLLANHGPVVAGKSLASAVYATEELEETAKLYLMLRDQTIRPLTDQQCDELRQRFPT